MKDIYPARANPGYIPSMIRQETMRDGTRSATDSSLGLCVGLLCLSAVAGWVQAGEIYKSIDANGNVTYSDHVDASMSQASEVQIKDREFPPRELHFCWTHCFTLILANGVYRRTDGTDGTAETWTVETFSAKSVVLHRHDAPADWNGYSPDVVYAGQVANGRLVGVTINGKPVSGVDASWGTALNTLPGSDAERDANNSANPDSSSGGTVSTAATPPPLPAEDQPTLPSDGYLWTPGYWSWRDQGYVWIPGAWVSPPEVGVLWTPAYWEPVGAVFVFHRGHWGATVGFYGGINYGYGYFGSGYSGGHWIGNSFAYNSAANHLNPTVAHHTYAASVADEASRGLSHAGGGHIGGSYAGGDSVGGGHTGISGAVAASHPPHQPSMPRAVNNPQPMTAVQRTRDPAPKPVELNRPAAGVKPPVPGVPRNFNHVPTRAAPVKE